MGHLLKYRFLQIIRVKSVMFWTMLFPIILGTLFYVSFGTSGNGVEQLEAVPVAVVKEDESEKGAVFREFLEQLDGDTIIVKEITEEKAMQLLEAGEVKGVYFAGEKQTLTVAASDLQESILESLLDSYLKNQAMFFDIMSTDPGKIEQAMQSMSEYREMIRETSLGGRTLNTFVQYYFALIAMACMYGCFMGTRSAMEMKANLTPLGARRNVTPTSRMKLIICDMIATFTVHYVNILILLGYLIFILKVDFGDQTGSMLLVSMIGSIIGVSVGMMIGSIGRWSASVKDGIGIGFSMICSFLAGLMIETMRNTVEQNFPIINRINPAALISDAFYCLNVYDDPVRYQRNLLIMVIMSIIFVGISFLAVRRECYESI